MTTWPFEIDDFDKQILDIILDEQTENYGVTRYRIKNQAQISQQITLGHMKEMEKRGFVRVISREKISTGRYSKKFQITTLGFIKYLQYISETGKPVVSVKKFNERINRSPNLLPWITKNWNQLSTINSEKMILHIILKSCSEIYVDNFSEQKVSFSVASGDVFIKNRKIRVHSGVHFKPKKNPKIHNFKKIDNNLEKLFTSIFICNLLNHLVLVSQNGEEALKRVIFSDNKIKKRCNVFLKGIESEQEIILDHIKDFQKRLAN